MKLKAKTASIGIQTGHTYNGAPVLRGENENQSIVERWRDIKFVVYNDIGKWHVYDAHVFEPAE